MMVDDRVVHAEIQKEKKRFKRDFVLPFFEPQSRVRRLQSDLSVYKRPPVPVYDKTFNDELWVQEWYMVRRKLTLKKSLTHLYSPKL